MLSRVSTSETIRRRDHYGSHYVFRQSILAAAIPPHLWSQEINTLLDLFRAGFYLLPLLDQYTLQFLLLYPQPGRIVGQPVRFRCQVPKGNNSRARTGISQRCSRSVHPDLTCASGDDFENVFKEASGCFGCLNDWRIVRRFLPTQENIPFELTPSSAVVASVLGLTFRVKMFLTISAWDQGLLFLCM